jgi:proteasome accessory factor B
MSAQARYTRIHRLLRILTLVQSHSGWTARRLAAECQVQPRTIFRDLGELEAAGIPIYFDEKARTYRLPQGFFLPPVSLTPEEALALAVICEKVAGGRQITHLAAAYRALSKIQASMPESIREEIARLARGVEIQAAPASPEDVDADVYVKVQRAIDERRVLACTYDSASRTGGTPASGLGLADPVNPDSSPGAGSPRTAPPREFLFEPYALLFSVRAWYVVGFHRTYRQVRHLKLSRFSALRLTDDRFDLPRTFSVEKHLGNAWRIIRGDRDYKVRILFDPVVASTMADTLWHKTQQIDEHPDGSATFRCTVSGLDEILWWVLGYGPHARVLEPADLRRRVAEAARRTAALYDDGLAGDHALTAPAHSRAAPARTRSGRTTPDASASAR